MKSLLTLFAVIAALSAWCRADVPEPVWTRTIGSADIEEAYAVCRLPSGNLVVGGRSYQEGGFSTNPMIAYLTPAGETVWSRVSRSTSFEDSTTVYGICALPDGGFVATGSGGSQWTGPFVTKFNYQGDTTWNVRYSSWMNSKLNGISRTVDGGYLVVGTLPQDFNFPNRIFVGRLGSGGAIRWTRNYGSETWGRGNAVLALPDTGCVIAGCLGSATDSNSASGCLMRLSPRADTVRWTRTYGTSDFNEILSVDRTNDGGFILAGRSNAFGNPDFDAWVIRTDSLGQIIWQQHFGSREDECAFSVKSVDEGYVVAGRTYVNDARGYDAYLFRLREGGAVDWSGNVGGNDFDEFRQLVTTPDGGFVVCGTTASTGAGSSDFYLMQFPPGTGWLGTVTDRTSHRGVPNVIIAIPSRAQTTVTDARGFYQMLVPPGVYTLVTYGSCTTRDTLRDVQVDLSVVDTLNWVVDQPQSYIPQSSLNFYVRNHIISTAPLLIRNDGPGLLDYLISASTVYPHSNWLSVLPASGSLAAGDSISVSVTVDADTSDDTILDYYGYLTIHENSCPDTAKRISVFATVLDANDHPVAVPRAFSLSAYPNPFNPTTTLNFTLPDREYVSLALFDITGRQVAILREGTLDAGAYHANVDGSSLPSGIYFARLQTPTRTQTRKLMLLK